MLCPKCKVVRLEALKLCGLTTDMLMCPKCGLTFIKGLLERDVVAAAAASSS